MTGRDLIKIQGLTTASIFTVYGSRGLRRGMTITEHCNIEHSEISPHGLANMNSMLLPSSQTGRRSLSAATRNDSILSSKQYS